MFRLWGREESSSQLNASPASASDIDNTDRNDSGEATVACSASDNNDHDCSDGGDNMICKTNARPRKNRSLNDQAKQICLNVFQNLLKRNDNHTTRKSVMNRAAALTGTPYPTMRHWVRALRAGGVVGRKTRSDVGRSKPPNSAMAELVRQAVNDAYEADKVATVKVVYKRLKQHYRVGFSKNTLRRWLPKMGFQFKIVKRQATIVESGSSGSHKSGTMTEEEEA